MKWTEVNIYTSTNAIELLCSSLMDLGIKGFVIRDSEDFNEFLHDENPKWDYIDDDLLVLSNCETSVTVYLPDNAQGAETFVSLKALLVEMKRSDTDNSFGRLELEFTSVSENDWANNWKQYFKPLKIGEKLLIKPSWETCDNIENRVILEIDPASSFGTGQHHTTRLCLELIENALNINDKVLDMGCGSGILSIATMLLGAESVVAIDIEENAVATAKENAVKNNISLDKYTALCGNIINDETLVNTIDDSYDLIVANIVADVIIAMKSYFARFLKKNGTLIISGIIEERLQEVLDNVTSAGFSVAETNIKDGWVAVKLIYV